jgi:cell division protein FtsW
LQKNHIDTPIFIIVAILLLIGALFSYSLPLYLETKYNLGEYHFLKNYTIFGIFGFIVMSILAFLNPDIWFKKIGWTIVIISSILIILMAFLPKEVVPVINGARRWIKISSFKFSPVELFKVGAIFFLAISFTRKVKQPKSIKEELKTVTPHLIGLGIFWILILIFQSDLGQVIVMASVFAFMLLIAGGKVKTFTLMISGGIFLVIFAIFSSNYRLERFKAWLALMSSNFLPHPLIEATNNSYGQVKEALNAIHHGGILGKGIGNGIFKLGFLSDVHTDFVLAGIAEETGIIGIGIIVILFSILIYRIFKIANRSEKKEYQLFAFGIGTLLSLQFILNALGVLSLIPIKGLTVPFISYGGSSLVANLIAIGMVLMISKRAKL